MKCTDCEHFNILYDPYRSGGILWDTGRAECTKYKLVVDTVSQKQIGKLVCVEPNVETEASTITTEDIEKMTKLAKGSTSWFAERLN